MTSGSNTSFLNDFAYAIRSVVRTIVGVFLLGLVLLVGLAFLAVIVVIGTFYWLGHKIGLIKDPPSVKFRRFQGRMAGRFIQAKLGKMGGFGQAGQGPFGQAGPFGQPGPGGAPGQAGPFGPGGAPGQAGPFGPEGAPGQASPFGPGGPFGQTGAPEAEGVDGVQEVEAEESVDAEELEEFHGSLEEYMRSKRR